MARRLAKNKILSPRDIQNAILDAMGDDAFTTQRLGEYVVMLAQMHGMLAANLAFTPGVSEEEHARIATASREAWNVGVEEMKASLQQMVSEGVLHVQKKE